MNDIGIHLLLFFLISAAIVLMSAFFADMDDARALRTYPKRLIYFLFGCAVLTGVMLLCEHTLASIY